MKIILDTNVLVAGLLSPFGPPGEIVRMVSAGTLQLCLDARILAEYAEVLHRVKFGFSADLVDALLDFIARSGLIVASSPLPHALPYPDDEPFLQVAIAGKAEFLVTGNLAHFPARLLCKVKVVAPGEFVTIYSKKRAEN